MLRTAMMVRSILQIRLQRFENSNYVICGRKIRLTEFHVSRENDSERQVIF